LFNVLAARAVPKKYLYGPENRQVSSGVPVLAFHKEKPVPKRDAGNFRCTDLPPPSGLFRVTGSEVQRVGPAIGTNAQVEEDFWQAIRVGPTEFSIRF
jgi:hypothetical protein